MVKFLVNIFSLYNLSYNNIEYQQGINQVRGDIREKESVPIMISKYFINKNDTQKLNIVINLLNINTIKFVYKILFNKHNRTFAREYKKLINILVNIRDNKNISNNQKNNEIY